MNTGGKTRTVPDQEKLSMKSEGTFWKPSYVLIAGLVLSFLLTFSTCRNVERQANDDFISVSKEIVLRVEARLEAHVLILRAGAAFFAVSDTVTRDEWREFIERSEVHNTLPGIQGVGFSYIIPLGKLEQHIEQLRQEGFPDYTVTPSYERDIYTSILYLEPFAGRNLRAFGFDMFSHPVRRKAMELARDYNLPMLSGRVELVQETGEDEQSGTLMYYPLYRKNMPVETIEERRAAIYGWIYSPYRMRDLMRGILGRWDDIERDTRIHLRVYDDSISSKSILFDSQRLNGDTRRPLLEREITLPVEFNGKKWVLHMTQPREVFLFNGEVLIVFISSVLISILLYMLSISFRKVSDRSRQIREQNEELRKLNATKDKFFSIIAHDLKGPFNAIIGFSRILIEQVHKKEYDGVSRYAEIIHQSSNAAMSLLMNLMEWSQSQTGRMEYNPEYFDMVELINEVELLSIDVASQKDIEIINEMPQHVPAYADHAMIGTVLRNLISNAIKFTRTGGKIVVSVKEKADNLLVSVSDNGIGIPENKLNMLFQIDKTYSTNGTQNEKGTGLGLILCKEFVDRNGGEIWAESKPADKHQNKQGGSVFYFTVPRNPSAV
jgi:signal transduction histidine kinase